MLLDVGFRPRSMDRSREAIVLSFMITVAKPLPNDFQENVRCMKEDLGMIFVPERKCWIGEIAAECYTDVLRVCGEFVLDMGDCPLSSLPRRELLKRIDSCAYLGGNE